MGNSLHNKIYLGRRTDNRRIKALMCATAVTSLALAWLALRLLK